MQCQSLFSVKDKKNIPNLSFAESYQKIVKAKLLSFCDTENLNTFGVVSEADNLNEMSSYFLCKIGKNITNFYLTI